MPESTNFFKNRIFLVSFVSVIIIGILAGGVFYYNSKQKDTKSDSKSSTKVKPPNKIEAKIKNKEITYASWIPDWGTDSGLESLKQNTKVIDSISPVWYEANKNGELVNKTPKNSQEMLDYASNNQIEIIPSIACFDHEILTEILQNQTNLDKHVDSILKTVLDNNYDGIDIDYESTKLSDKDKFFEFLEKLSGKLKTNQKKLSIAVLAKWGDDVIYPGLKETRAVQDWSKIAPLVDEIRIMTYDYTGGGSLYPGPIGPLNWQEDVIKYALTKAPKEKYVLGVHLYGYEQWVEVKNPSQDKKFGDPKLKFTPDFKNQTSGEEPMRSYTYQTVQRILKDYPGTTDNYQGEKIYSYSKTNDDTGILENRVLVYIDPEGIQARKDLAKKYGLQGIAFWRVGADGDLLKGLK
jgi:spore germination protein YaaH